MRWNGEVGWWELSLFFFSRSVRPLHHHNRCCSEAVFPFTVNDVLLRLKLHVSLSAMICSTCTSIYNVKGTWITHNLSLGLRFTYRLLRGAQAQRACISVVHAVGGDSPGGVSREHKVTCDQPVVLIRA